MLEDQHDVIMLDGNRDGGQAEAWIRHGSAGEQVERPAMAWTRNFFPAALAEPQRRSRMRTPVGIGHQLALEASD